MGIFCIGANHRTAPVELRERFAYPTSSLRYALSRAACGREETAFPFSELAILSTCNRIELYAVADRNGVSDSQRFATLTDFIAETRNLDRGAIEPHLYRFTGLDAVRHLSRVAAGLDSMVLGESEVLGQVAHAHETALALSASGDVLTHVFRTAIRAGRRARVETRIGQNAASLSSVALRAAERELGSLEGASLVLVGTGKMGTQTAVAFRERGGSQLIVASRTQERASAMAERWGARPITYERLPEVLVDADVVVTATEAPHPIIDVETVRSVVRNGRSSDLIVIDLAVPRDVEAGVAEVVGVRLFDLDDLQALLEDNVEERRREVPRVEGVIAAEAVEFQRWWRGRGLTPVLAQLRRRAEAIRRREVAKALRRMPELDAASREQIERLTLSIVNRLWHDPAARLRTQAHDGAASRYADLLSELFDVEVAPHDDPPPMDIR